MTLGRPGQALIKVVGVQNNREFHQIRKNILTHKLWELQQVPDHRVTLRSFFMPPVLHTKKYDFFMVLSKKEKKLDVVGLLITDPFLTTSTTFF